MHTFSRRLGLWAAAIGSLLLIPLAGTFLNPSAHLNGGSGGGFDWMPGDFVVMGALLAATALVFELVTSRLHTMRSKVIAGVLILLCLLYILAELAVGIFTNWGS